MAGLHGGVRPSGCRELLICDVFRTCKTRKMIRADFDTMAPMTQLLLSVQVLACLLSAGVSLCLTWQDSNTLLLYHSRKLCLY